MELPPAEFYSYDIETAIDGKIVDYPTMLSCSNGINNFVAVGEDNVRSLGIALRDSGADLVTWNGWAFDEPVLARWGLQMPMSHDGMVMAYFDDETQSLSLESCAVKYLGVKGWKKGSNDWKTFDPTSLEAAKYAARDSRYTLRVFEVLRGRLGKRNKTITKIVASARRALDKQTERGIYIDGCAVDRERRNAEDVRDRSLNWIKSVTGLGFNPNSSAQVGKFLLDAGYTLPRTETGKPSTGVAVLQSINDEFCRTLLDYRGAVKTLSTYVKPYERIISEDGRVHPEYTLIRTLTGRSSARNLNVQNLPRSYKDFFGAPRGRLFVECDYSSIEFRIAAWFARERVICESYREDPSWDAHLWFAMRYYEQETIATANMLALCGGLPTNGVGSKILRFLLPSFDSDAERSETKEVLEYLHRSGWGWQWELPTRPTEREESLLERGRSKVSLLPEELLRELQCFREKAYGQRREVRVEFDSPSFRREQTEQRGFKPSDAMQALSSASSSLLNAIDPDWKLRRQQAKSGNFSLLYLGNGYTLYEYANKQGVKMSIETAEEIYRFWHDTFPGFKRLYKETREELEETGQIEGPTGQIRHFGDFSLIPRHKRLECLRQAVNFKVQNLSAHLAYIAMAELERMSIPCTGFVHDAILFEMENEKELEESMPKINYAMVEHPVNFLRQNFDIELDIPLMIEMKCNHG